MIDRKKYSLLRTYRLQGLDCPTCAAKLEAALRKKNGLSDTRVHFATLSAELNPAYESQAREVIRRLEPQVTLVSPGATPTRRSEGDGNLRLLLIGVSGLLLLFGLFFEQRLHTFPMWEYALFVTAYLLVGGKVIWTAVSKLLRGDLFSEHFLMSVATIGAFLVHQMPEAVGVMLFYAIGEYLEEVAVHRSRRSISRLLEIRPEAANLVTNRDVQRVAPETVPIGSTILVRPGERVPLDGEVLDGSSYLDTSALTGESLPRDVRAGDSVLAGMVNGPGLLRVRTTHLFTDSSLAKILALVQDAVGHKAPTERFITRFARIYTPAVVAGAVLFAILPPLLIPGATFAEWVYRALILLVISCPCALLVSIPLGYFGGLGGASRAGVLVKGGNFLEALAHPRTVAFDKTGTLTRGVFRVEKVETTPGFHPEEVLRWGALAEAQSNHPIGRSVVEAWGRPLSPEEAGNVQEIRGFGVSVRIQGKQVLVGNEALLAKEGVPVLPGANGGTRVYVAMDGTLAGWLVVVDQLKPDAEKAIRELKALGVRDLVMLSGDAKPVAEGIARRLGIPRTYAELLPEEKVQRVEALQREPGKGAVIFVGDGINDAPVLARADVGVAMGGLGSDAAIEAADVVIMDDRPSKLAQAIRLARRTRAIVIQNIALALGVKGIFMVMGLLGVATMWEAVIADMGVALLAILNAARALRVGKEPEAAEGGYPLASSSGLGRRMG
jgi:Cd2+/Zn2+-exporting ATPase